MVELLDAFILELLGYLVDVDAERRQLLQNPVGFPGILFSPQRGITLGVLIVELQIVLTCSDPQELAGVVTFLPLQ